MFKRFLFLFLIIFQILILSCGAQNQSSNLAHHTGRGFRNPWPGDEHRGFYDLLKWAVWERIRGQKPEKQDHYDFSVVENDGNYLQENRSDFTVTWIGHSTLLVQMKGLNILTDPIWSERCSPFQWIGPKRYVKPGIDFENLPEIDLVIISHNHYDHLDKNTIKKLGNKSFYLVPLGAGEFLADQGINRYQEMDWWDSIFFNQVQIICTPAQHFSGRLGVDRDRTLWASWVLKSDTASFYFGGDSGYFPEYKKIGELYGPFDLIALPIGAYLPRWFMRPVHLSPDEAVDAFVDLRGEIFVPIHWGTFGLADEPLDQPPQDLKKKILSGNLAEDKFWILKHGETRVIKNLPFIVKQESSP